MGESREDSTDDEAAESSLYSEYNVAESSADVSSTYSSGSELVNRFKNGPEKREQERLSAREKRH